MATAEVSALQLRVTALETQLSTEKAKVSRRPQRSSFASFPAGHFSRYLPLGGRCAG